MKSTESLKSLYFEILKDVDPSFFDKNHEFSKYLEGLSGLFLTSLPDGYFESSQKIMIIGAETAGWDVIKNHPYVDINQYIDLAVDKHKQFQMKEIDAEKNNDRGNTFHNFTRALVRKTCANGIVYCNLFCFDWKKKSPIKTKYFEEIKQISKLLIQAQLNFFEPDFIVFANGTASYAYRREFFPIQHCSDYFYLKDKGIPDAHFWEFTYQNKFKCFRIQHPSTRQVELGKKTRSLLIDMLAENM